MPSVKKIISKMHNQPNGIRIEEVNKVLEAFGYIHVRTKGDHYQFLNRETGDLITVKLDSPLKRVYIEDILKRIGEK